MNYENKKVIYLIYLPNIRMNFSVCVINSSIPQQSSHLYNEYISFFFFLFKRARET